MVAPITPAVVPKDQPELTKARLEKCSSVPLTEEGGAIERVNQLLQPSWSLVEQADGRTVDLNDVFRPYNSNKKWELIQHFRNAGWTVTSGSWGVTSGSLREYYPYMLFKLPANCRAAEE